MSLHTRKGVNAKQMRTQFRNTIILLFVCVREFEWISEMRCRATGRRAKCACIYIHMWRICQTLECTCAFIYTTVGVCSGGFSHSRDDAHCLCTQHAGALRVGCAYGWMWAINAMRERFDASWRFNPFRVGCAECGRSRNSNVLRTLHTVVVIVAWQRHSTMVHHHQIGVVRADCLSQWRRIIRDAKAHAPSIRRLCWMLDERRLCATTGIEWEDWVCVNACSVHVGKVLHSVLIEL